MFTYNQSHILAGSADQTLFHDVTSSAEMTWSVLEVDKDNKD